MSRILFVLTSYDRMLNGDPTGLWLEEYAVPYYRLTAAGHEVVVTSVAGGPVPIDPNSMPADEQANEWREAIQHLDATESFQSRDPADFDAVYLPGGHGTVFDMPYNRALHRLLFGFEEAGKPIASVCHGPAVFAGMRRDDGTPYIQGRTVAGFSDEEERQAGGVGKVPFLLESRLRELGAHYSGGEAWQPYAVEDPGLITGQNPQSSEAVAKRLIAALG